MGLAANGHGNWRSTARAAAWLRLQAAPGGWLGGSRDTGRRYSTCLVRSSTTSVFLSQHPSALISIFFASGNGHAAGLSGTLPGPSEVIYGNLPLPRSRLRWRLPRISPCRAASSARDLLLRWNLVHSGATPVQA